MRCLAACCLLSLLLFAYVARAQEHDPRSVGASVKRDAGDSVCIRCHKEQSLLFVHTAHARTSQVATPRLVQSLMKGRTKQTLVISDLAQTAMPSLTFEMHAPDGRLEQSARTGWPGNLYTRTETVDIILGSGKRGRTFLYWNRDQLFELPVSHWTEGNQWINSPGYTDGTADFTRPVNPGCLECHATAVQALSGSPLENRYIRSSFIGGIACSTCHGDGAAHIQQEKRPAGESGGESRILNPAKFSRDRQVDLCALCHNGIQRQTLAPAFSYVPGQPLDQYFKPLPAPEVQHPDVHGDQVGLLKRSRCYLASANMSCSTCHNVHDVERTAASYSDRCLACHQWQACPKAKLMGPASRQNCIDCHMPVEQTNVIVSETVGRKLRASMRTHWIKPYPERAALTNP